ncbi:MAG: ribonuclease HII, partial [Oscillospiraceae bacterium]
MAGSPSKHHKSDADQLVLEGVDAGQLDLREFDRVVYEKFGTVCGIDEAGRGPLAGDVYAAAVILDCDNPIEGLNDSKKLTPKKREKLFDEIVAKAKAYCIAVSTVEQIEATDILSADLDAMK